MKKYVYDRKSNGIHMFNVQKQYEKIKVAARIIASIPDPSSIIVSIIPNISVFSSKPFVSKF